MSGYESSRPASDLAPPPKGPAPGAKPQPRKIRPNPSHPPPTASTRGYARRDRFVGWLANQVLRLASRHYRAMIGGAIHYGLDAAARDAGHTPPR